MRDFDYIKLGYKLLTPEISALLATIHEFRGKQEFYCTAKPAVLEKLLELAVIQSTDASNRLEGISTSPARLKALIAEKAVPASCNEREIAGYRDVLNTIHGNFEYIPVRPNTILQLHRDLYSFQASGMAGRWKDSDNLIAETVRDGKQFIRFIPVKAFETAETMEKLCNAYQKAIGDGTHDSLLLSVLFIFDFLCIHPFNDGNGRISRLLTLLLLYQCGYLVGKYISLEMLVEKSKVSYYEALRASSIQWHEEQNDYLPIIRYLLGIILKGYRELDQRLQNVVLVKHLKADRVRLLFSQRLGKLTKQDIQQLCPDISLALIEQTLKKLQDDGTIRKIGAGRNTGYVSNEA